MKKIYSLLTPVLVLFIIALNSCNTSSLDDCCCTDNFSYTGTPDTLFPIEFPNVITPNVDGFNDRLVIEAIQNIGLPLLQVFDRDNKLMFRDESFQNDWKGTDMSDQDLPEGLYHVIVTFPNVEYRYDVSIVREKGKSQNCLQECSPQDPADPLLH